MEIDDLPLETLLEVFKNTDGCTLARCREVCTKWKEIIDSTDLLWQEFCERDFKHTSKIAKTKSGHEIKWYHIYKNLKMWANVSTAEMKLRDFYKFSFHDKCHALQIDHNILPLQDSRGFILYEISTQKCLPVIIPERTCLRICHNDRATIILTKFGIHLQRTVENCANQMYVYFRANNFALTKNILYFFNERDVYKCLLTSDVLKSEHIIRSDYDIKEIEVKGTTIYLFTICGKIVTISKESIKVTPIDIPMEWIKQIKHICPVDNKNFVCYSRNLFKIETDKYQHLYLDFPSITALFFYGDVVIIGTRAGEILVYRLSSQVRGAKPIFENLAVLPGNRYAVYLDVCERKTGPAIVVGTFFEIMLLEITFFPHEKNRVSYPPNKLCMVKRLLLLKDRLRYN